MHISTDWEGDSGSGMWFESVNQLLLNKDDNRFETVISSSSCLSITAESSNPGEISILVDFASSLRVKHKYLVVNTLQLNTTLLQNKRMNFNVFLNIVGSGKKCSIYPHIVIQCLQHT